MYEAVYHPWMYCRKTENFLGALILWDRIFTITPRSYVSDDINPFHQKLLMNNVIQEIDLRNQRSIIEDTARNFENLCKNESVFNFVIESMKNFDGFDETHFRIHHEKTIISEMLRIQEKIKEYRIECSDRWVYLPRELTALYMFILAETIAKIRGASLLSDLDETYALYKRFFIRNELDSNEISCRKQAVIINVLTKWMAIRDDVSIVDVLRFRDDHKDDLIKTQKLIRQIKLDIPDSYDYSILDLNMKERIEELDETIKLIKANMSSRGFVIKNVPLGSLVGCITGAASAFIQDLSNYWSLAAASGGVLIDIYVNRIKENIPSSDLVETHRYLIDAKRKFSCE